MCLPPLTPSSLSLVRDPHAKHLSPTRKAARPLVTQTLKPEPPIDKSDGSTLRRNTVFLLVREVRRQEMQASWTG